VNFPALDLGVKTMKLSQHTPHWFRSLWPRSAVKREIDEELRFHLE
jgi:hypothetical protein